MFPAFPNPTNPGAVPDEASFLTLRVTKADLDQLARGDLSPKRSPPDSDHQRLPGPARHLFLHPTRFLKPPSSPNS